MKQKHILHLYNRASFGIGKHLATLQKPSKQKVLKNLFEASITYDKLEVNTNEIDVLNASSPRKLRKDLGEEAFRKLKKKRQELVIQLNFAWIDRLQQNPSLREKMTLFWANVFVCRDNNNIFHIQRYNNTLRHHALGDFKAFVKAIAKEASMSKYLNNRQNRKQSPNENFARELMELFTLGIGNYTEIDIKEAAKAFTGWSFETNGDFRLRTSQHDTGLKTFFGKTGNFNGEDIINIILEQKQCARFICDKVYRYFVNPTVNQNHLEEITTIFYKDYNIENLMYYIFKSDWFYEEENIGVKIKSPMELLVGIHQIVPIQFDKKTQLRYLQKMMGQVLLFPNNVSGWKGNTYWIDSNTLMFRMRLPSLLLNNAVINLEEKGDFEDSFEDYYNVTQKRNKYLKTTVNWSSFEKKYDAFTPNKLTKIIIQSKMDIDTKIFLENLQIKSNKDFCIQLMSIPEYQLC